MGTTVAIAETIEDPWRTALENVPTVSLLLQAPASALLEEGVVRPLEVRRITGREAQHFDELVEPTVSALLLVVEAVLDDESAIKLEDRNIAFADASGRAWVPGAPRSSKGRPTRRRMRTSSLRAAQLLADHPDVTWTEPALSKRAGVSSGATHNLVRALLDLNLLERGGDRKAGVRVREVRGLRRWLVEEARRERPHTLTCYVPDVRGLPQDIDGIPLVRSGGEGARLLGLPVMTSIQRVLIRVSIKSDMEDLPARLGGLRTTAGANVMLVADPGRFAESDAHRIGAMWVAPASRVAVDLTFEPRGSAASSIFLDLWGEEVM